MKATDFEVGNVISDGTLIVVIRPDRDIDTGSYLCSTINIADGGWHVSWCMLTDLTGNNWHRLVPEAVLTEADRVTDLSTLEEGEQIITVYPDKTLAYHWIPGWYNQGGARVYRDPRPLPRIEAAKERTLEERIADYLLVDIRHFSGDRETATRIAAEIVAMVKGATP